VDDGGPLDIPKQGVLEPFEQTYAISPWQFRTLTPFTIEKGQIGLAPVQAEN
jgi:hypothetical protein